MMTDLESILSSLKLTGADWIGLREVREKQIYRRVRNGQLENNHHSTSHGIMVEVLCEGQFAYAATPRLDRESIQRAAERALHLARWASRFKLFSFSPDVRPQAVGTYTSPARLRQLSTREIIDTMVRLSEGLKVSPQVVDTEVLSIVVEHDTQFVSSNGSRVEQSLLLLTTDMNATASEGNLTQRRSQNGWFTHSYQAGLELLQDESRFESAQVVGHQAVELLTAEECPVETTSLVLAPDQMYLQIHESVGHPLELDRILGDERNYAGSSFVKLTDFGHLQYGSPLMNIVFDPTQAGELAIFGTSLLDLTDFQETFVETGTYDSRSPGGCRVPGALVNNFTFTS